MNRRSFFLGAASLLAAPPIVRAASIMPVKAAVEEQVLWPVTTIYRGINIGDRFYVLGEDAMYVVTASGQQLLT